MPVPIAQHGSELFPQTNKQDRTSRFHLDTRTSAPENKIQGQGLTPRYEETSSFAKADKSGARFNKMMQSLKLVEAILNETIKGTEDLRFGQKIALELRHDTLVKDSLVYLNAHTLALSKGARRRKRLARRLFHTAKAQRDIVHEHILGMDLTAYAGKMTFGEAILEANSGFSLKGRGNVPQEEKRETLDMPFVKLGQVDDRVMQQIALKREGLRGTEDKGYSGVGDGMSKMLRMPNLKGQEGVTDENNLLDEGTTYYFKRNLGDISARVDVQREKLEAVKELTYEEAVALLRDKEPDFVPPANPTARQREGVRVKAAIYDPRWEEAEQDKRQGFIQSLRNVSRDLLDPNNKERVNYEGGGIEYINKLILEKMYKEFPSIAVRAQEITARFEKESARLRADKTETLPTEYPKIQGLTDRKKLEKGYVSKAVFRDRGIHRRSANTAKKDVAYYKIDRLLGLNIVPKTILAEDSHGRTGRLMEQFKGKESMNFINESFEKDHKAAREKFRKARHFYKRLSEMHLLDLICGQGDRHGGNFTIYENSEGELDVQAFDNDLSFGTKKGGFRGMIKSGGFSNFVPKETAEKVLGLTIDSIKAVCGGLLSEEEFEAMNDRLQQVQAAIRQKKDEGELLSDDDWNNLSDSQIEEFIWEDRATSGMSMELLGANIRSDIAQKKDKEYEEVRYEGLGDIKPDDDYVSLYTAMKHRILANENLWWNKEELITAPTDNSEQRMMSKYYAPGEIEGEMDSEIEKLNSAFQKLNDILPDVTEDVDWSGIEVDVDKLPS